MGGRQRVGAVSVVETVAFVGAAPFVAAVAVLVKDEARARPRRQRYSQRMRPRHPQKSRGRGVSRHLPEGQLRCKP